MEASRYFWYCCGRSVGLIVAGVNDWGKRTLDIRLPWAVRASKGVVSGTGSSMAATAVECMCVECLFRVVGCPVFKACAEAVGGKGGSEGH